MRTGDVFMHGGNPARALLVVTVALAGAGCAHGRPAAGANVDELTRQMAKLRAQNATYLRQIEELENRVFILTDQVEAERRRDGDAPVASAPAGAGPVLPRVMLKPGQGVPGTDDVVTSEDSDVEYVGEAARTSTKRPVLRLVGGPGERAPEPAAAPEEPAAKRVARPLLTNGLPVTLVGEVGRRPGPPARSQELYRRALDALTAGQHADAAAGFREFLRLHPQHEFADNAQYWLGECYYDLKDFGAAAREFRRVVERYPDGNKVPDALLKLAYAELAAGDAAAGRGTLAKLARQYPKHEAAGRAQTKLAELGDAQRLGKEGP